MGQKTLHAVVYKDADSDQWVASCVEYDVATQGDSEEHALSLIQEAVELHLAALDKDQLSRIDNAVGSEPVVRSFKARAPAIFDE